MTSQTRRIKCLLLPQHLAAAAGYPAATCTAAFVTFNAHGPDSEPAFIVEVIVEGPAATLDRPPAR